VIYKGLRLSDKQEKNSFEKTKEILKQISAALNFEEAAVLIPRCSLLVAT
jgi:hypothetical protein